MTVTDPYTGIGVITRGVFDSDMAAISLSLHSSCNDIALNEKNSPSFCQIHFYRGIFHLLSSCTLSTLRAFNSSSFHPSSPQIHPFSMIPVTPQSKNRLSDNSFNPRTRESATGHGKPQKVDVEVSIHALVRVRLPSPPRGNPGRCFNPRTRESATSINLNQWVWVIVSIHALVRVRRGGYGRMMLSAEFQSTHS